jgi:hypothetical protein
MSPIKSFHAELNRHCEKVEIVLNKGASVPVLGLGCTIARALFAKVQVVASLAFIALGVTSVVGGSLLGYMNPEKLQNCKDLTTMGVEYLGHGLLNELTVLRELVLSVTLVGNIAWLGLGHLITGGTTFSPFHNYTVIV